MVAATLYPGGVCSSNRAVAIDTPPEFGVTGPNEAVGAVREPDDSTSLPSRLSVTKYCSDCSYRTAMVGLAVHEKHRSFTLGAYVRESVREMRPTRPSGATTCTSPNLTPKSDVPYMLDRLMQGAPTTAA